MKSIISVLSCFIKYSTIILFFILIPLMYGILSLFLLLLLYHIYEYDILVIVQLYISFYLTIVVTFLLFSGTILYDFFYSYKNTNVAG